jgi:hypothetical protein
VSSPPDPREARRAQRERRRRRNPYVRPLLWTAALLAALLLGISLGRALEDGPAPGGTQTSVRTLKPQPLAPAAKTVTLTVTTG